MTVATSLAAPTKMILRESCLIVWWPYVLIVVVVLDFTLFLARPETSTFYLIQYYCTKYKSLL